MALQKSLVDRFEGKYELVPWSGCWLWTGQMDEKGYGRIGIGNKYRYAHCVSFELHNGQLNGLDVLHHCDVPCCVNPAHLFLGTQGDNNRDRDAKGRHVALRGQQNGMAKLTPENIRRIRKSQLSSLALAMEIDIDASTIRKVRRGALWGSVL